MFRSAASRSAVRSLANSSRFNSTTPRSFTAQLWTTAKRPQPYALRAPLALTRLESGKAPDKPVSEINLKEEAKLAKEKLKPHPELVSSESSIHPLTSEVGIENAPKDTDMLGGIKADMGTIRETFSLESVPREAYYIGLAGFLPYLATSLSTVYCAWEINTSAHTGTGYLLSEKQAELILHVLEPIQIGYGAILISFLGAIHWGLEFAGYGGKHGYSRYLTGVWTTALAWPTILLPAESALISQFLLFNFLYYNDSRAAKRGLAPPWYSVYRFVLTFIVGSAIVVSLIGRGQIADRISAPSGATERIRALRDHQDQDLQEEEKYKRESRVEADEAEDEPEEEDSGDDEKDDGEQDDDKDDKKADKKGSDDKGDKGEKDDKAGKDDKKDKKGKDE